MQCRVLYPGNVHSWCVYQTRDPAVCCSQHDCLDDIDFGGSKPGVKNILGGAASFAVVGARLVAGSAHARAVSWIVDVGSDFPSETLAAIQSWGTDCVIREEHGRLTTRAWNGYHPNEKRGMLRTYIIQTVQN